MSLLRALTDHYTRLWTSPAPPPDWQRLSLRAQDSRLALGLLAVPLLTAPWWRPLATLLGLAPQGTAFCLAVMALVVGLRLVLDIPLYSARAMPLIGGLGAVLLSRGEQHAWAAVAALAHPGLAG